MGDQNDNNDNNDQTPPHHEPTMTTMMRLLLASQGGGPAASLAGRQLVDILERTRYSPLERTFESKQLDIKYE